MALSNIQAVRLFISDRVEPYTFSDEDIQYFLDMSGGSVRQASILALYAIIGDLAKNKAIYRETTGDIEVWSNAIDWYKLLLGSFDSNPMLGLGSLMPYAAGIDRCDVLANDMDLSVNRANIPKTDCGVFNCLHKFQYGMPELPRWVVVPL